MDRATVRRAAAVPQGEIAKLYDGLAAHYDLWAALTEAKARRRALKLAAVRDGQAVLEVAVGTGIAFEQIVRSNPRGRNVGVDLSPGMLARTRGRLRRAGLTNFELALGSAFALAVADSSVDTLLNGYMFDLVSEAEWPRILSEFRRVLRPGGRLVLMSMTFGERFGSGVFERVSARAPRLMGGCRGVRLTPVLEDQGFVVRSRTYVQQSFFPSEVILARAPEPAAALAG
jgi:ubiquinone/menaquinone biosynthesis C-methylase UbiE